MNQFSVVSFFDPQFIVLLVIAVCGLYYANAVVYKKMRKLKRQASKKNKPSANAPLSFRSKKSQEQDIHQQGQADLETYRKTPYNKVFIGLWYERQVGYELEKDGYYVDFNGAHKGFSDMGRDLIAQNRTEILVIQTKCKSEKRLIHEKDVFALFGTTEYYRHEMSAKKPVRAVLVSSTGFSENALKAGQALNVSLKTIKLDKNYPMIKCNVGSDGQKIYHLPFDPSYDKVCITPQKGDLYVSTTAEAAALGFRRARNFKKSKSA